MDSEKGRLQCVQPEVQNKALNKESSEKSCQLGSPQSIPAAMGKWPKQPPVMLQPGMNCRKKSPRVGRLSTAQGRHGHRAHRSPTAEEE